MARLSKEEQIRLLNSVRVNVQRIKSGTNYFQAIDENSPNLEVAATFVYDLAEKYYGLRGLIGAGLRTQESAQSEMETQIVRAIRDVRDWADENRGNEEVKYASRRLLEVLLESQERTGYNKVISNR